MVFFQRFFFSKRPYFPTFFLQKVSFFSRGIFFQRGLDFSDFFQTFFQRLFFQILSKGFFSFPNFLFREFF